MTENEMNTLYAVINREGEFKLFINENYAGYYASNLSREHKQGVTIYKVEGLKLNVDSTVMPTFQNDDFPLGKACSNQDEECEACQ